jgi:hypothetical protein
LRLSNLRLKHGDGNLGLPEAALSIPSFRRCQRAPPQVLLRSSRRAAE